MVRYMLASAALAFSVWVGAAPANATADGYQYWGQFTFEGVTVPGGQLYHRIEGDGYHVDTDGANYGSVGNLCDASVRFTYGNGAKHIDGNVHSGCSHVGQWKYKVNQNMPRGDACAELWVKNWRRLVAKQCHYISP